MCETRISSLLGKITVLVLICFSSLSAQARYGGGTGQPYDPYLIYDANQMNAIGADQNDWDKHFLLCADIDLSEYTGTSFNIIGEHYYDEGWVLNPFTGVFDGNGNTISNFTYTSTAKDNIGIFGYVDSPGEIKDLGLIAPYVDAGTGEYVSALVGRNGGTISSCYTQGGSITGGDRFIGGLVGYVGYITGYNDPGTITNCYSTSSVTGNTQVGGLVGRNYGGTINNCCSTNSVTGDDYIGGLVGYNLGTITNCYSSGGVSGCNSVGGLVGHDHEGTITNSCATGNVTGTRHVGGLLGCNDDYKISNCYSTGSVTGDDYVGGLVGANRRGTIINCYSTGSVEGDNYVGGLLGYNEWYAEVFDSFWNNETSGQTTSAGGISKTTAEMQLQITYTDAGWDFNTPVWTIDEGVDYPRLWWEFVPVLHAEPEVTLGTSNIISWEPIAGRVGYYTECAVDASFTSISYNSGWITQTSYKFTGLQLGRKYWYSMKARNAAGVESQWSNMESSLQCSLSGAVETLLSTESLKNKNMKNTLLNKIESAMKMIEQDNYIGALSKLEQDILQKTNGCAETGRPDKNDWIITCEQQSQIYPLIIETIEYVRSLKD